MADAEPRDVALERRMEAENDPVLRAGDADAEEFGFDDPTERFAGESPGVTEATGRPGL